MSEDAMRKYLKSLSDEEFLERVTMNQLVLALDKTIKPPHTTCPNPKCKNEVMKCIVFEKLMPSRVQGRYICKCGASVILEYDLYEE